MTSPDLGRCNRALTSSTLTHSPPSPPPRLLARRSLACPTGRSTDEREPARSSLDPLAIRSRGGSIFERIVGNILLFSSKRIENLSMVFFFWNEKRYNFRKMQEGSFFRESNDWIFIGSKKEEEGKESISLRKQFQRQFTFIRMYPRFVAAPHTHTYTGVRKKRSRVTLTMHRLGRHEL